MIFRISAAEELVAFALANAPQTTSAVPVLSHAFGSSTGIPSMLKLHWLKSTFAPKPPGAVLTIFFSWREAWLDFEHGLGSSERARLPLIYHIGQSEGLERSAGAARWAAPSVPARNKTNPPAIKKQNHYRINMASP